MHVKLEWRPRAGLPNRAPGRFLSQRTADASFVGASSAIKNVAYYAMNTGATAQSGL